MSEEHTISSAEKGRQQPTSKKVTVSVRLLAGLGILLALCSLSFYTGTAYQKGKSPSADTASDGNRFTNGFGSGFQGRRMGAFGTVSAVTSTSITIDEQRTGSTTTYTVNSSTTFNNAGASATISDLKVGDTVLIQSSDSSSTVATRVLINPSFGDGPNTPGDESDNSNSQAN